MKSANNLKGHLLTQDGILYFRVYDKNYEFTDYRVAHHDLSITITDPDAYVYESEDGPIINYSPETLGI